MGAKSAPSGVGSQRVAKQVQVRSAPGVYGKRLCLNLRSTWTAGLSMRHVYDCPHLRGVPSHKAGNELRQHLDERKFSVGSEMINTGGGSEERAFLVPSRRKYRPLHIATELT
jgi:hypothetical protein